MMLLLSCPFTLYHFAPFFSFFFLILLFLVLILLCQSPNKHRTIRAETLEILWNLTSAFNYSSLLVGWGSHSSLLNSYPSLLSGQPMTFVGLTGLTLAPPLQPIPPYPLHLLPLTTPSWTHYTYMYIYIYM
jgi:hypothetical protein